MSSGACQVAALLTVLGLLTAISLANGASSRGLLASADTNSTRECASAIAEGVVAPNATWRNVAQNSTLQQDLVSQIVDNVLLGDQRCTSLIRANDTTQSLTLTWMQYPAWMNGLFTEWVWRLKTDKSTAVYFTHVIFEGPQQLPPPNVIVAASSMRDYAATHNDDAVVYSSDLSGFSASYAVEQKGIADYVENVCLDRSNPRGMLHPRVFLLTFYRADALAALAAAGLTASPAPPDDWEGLLSLLQAHALAMQLYGNDTSAAAAGAAAQAAAAASTAMISGNANSIASGSASGGATGPVVSGVALPSRGLCVTEDATCGRLGDLMTAMAASYLQSVGTLQGYLFDLTRPPAEAQALINSTAWRRAVDMLRQLLQYNAPEVGISGNAALQCHSFSPWFAAGDCMVTIEWDTAFLYMGVPALKEAGVLGVAPLPGSREVADPAGWNIATPGRSASPGDSMIPCNLTVCATGRNHDLLYLTPVGQQAGVLAAARAARANCSTGGVARMEAVAAAAAATTVTTAVVVNRAPYSAAYDYYVYINYELIAMVDLGKEMSIIQLNMAQRLDSERRLRQDAVDALRQAFTGTDNHTAWSADYPATPWWAALAWWAAAGGDAATAAAALPAAALAPYLQAGLDPGATALYLRALWHAIHAPNAAPDIPAPAMVNWFKWATSHAAVSLTARMGSSSVNSAVMVLERVFALVNEAHTAGLVRSSYDVAVGATPWEAPEVKSDAEGTTTAKKSTLTTGPLIGLVVGVTMGLLLGLMLLVQVLRLRSRHRDLLGRVQAPRAGQDTTLLISDVQSSTALWEQLPVPVMDATLRIHHSTVRQLLPQYDGYESATEGDSFILAFADPANAVAFAAACQVALMLQGWPQELLLHPAAEPVLVDPQSGEAAQQAAVPGADNRRMGSLSPLPRSFLGRWAGTPAQSLFSRARVAATALRGNGGSGDSGALSAPPALRPPFSGGSMYDMSMNDMSAHSRLFGPGGRVFAAFGTGTMRRSMERLRPIISGAVQTASPGPPAGLSPPTGIPAAVDAKVSLTLRTRPALAEGAAPAAAAGGAPSSGGGGGDGGDDGEPARADSLTTKSVAFHGIPENSPCFGEPGALVIAPGGGRQPSLMAGVGAAREPSLMAGVGGGREPSLMAGVGVGREPSLLAGVGGGRELSLMAGVGGGRDPSLLAGGGGVTKRDSSAALGGGFVGREGSVLGGGFVGREGSIFARVGIAGLKCAFSPLGGQRANAYNTSVPAGSGPGSLIPGLGGTAAIAPWISTKWSLRLLEVFPLVAPQDAPNSVVTAQTLKNPWVMMPSGRLALLAYRGLRVRMGIHTGLDDPQYISFNKVGSAYKYYGPFAQTAKCTAEAAPGGLVVLSGQAFARLRNTLAGPGPTAGGGGGGAAGGSSGGAIITRHRNIEAIVVYGGHHVPVTAATSTKGMAPPPAAAPPDSGRRSLRMRLASAGGRRASNTRPSTANSVTGGSGEGTAFYQAVPSELACRLALSPPIVSAKVVQLGSLEAPTGCICVAFMYVVGASTLLNDLPGPAARALDQFQRLACRLLGQKGGYLVEGGDGLVLAAFSNPTSAVEWALDCVAGLKTVAWEDELLGHWLCEEVLSVGLANGDALAEQQEGTSMLQSADLTAAAALMSVVGRGSLEGDPVTAASVPASRIVSPAPSSNGHRSLRRGLSRMPSLARLGARATTQRVLERGLRIKVGLDAGPATHQLHHASGRLSYRGKVMNRASRVAGKAAAGQVVCTDTVWHACIMGPQRLDSKGTGGEGASVGVNGSAAVEEDDDGEADPGPGLVGVSLGRVTLRGVSTPVELIQCMRASS